MPHRYPEGQLVAVHAWSGTQVVLALSQTWPAEHWPP
jgi:hypothetical protein